MPNHDSEDFREQFLDDYYAESHEHLTAIRRNLLAVESQVSQGTVDVGVLDDLFRSFHTIKGISGMVGLTAAEELAHSIESMLRSLRQAELAFSVDRLDALIAGVALLENVIDARRANAEIPAVETAIKNFEALSVAGSEPASIAASVRAGSPHETSGLQSAVRRWNLLFTPNPDLSEKGVNINSVRERVKEIGRILKAVPQVKKHGEISFHFVVETDADLSVFEDWREDGIEVTPSLDEIQDAVSPNLPATASNLVRVGLDRLDEIMLLVGEMVTCRALLESQIRQAKKSLPAAEWRAVWETTQSLSRQLRNLRDSVVRVRMVQIREVFERMHFVIRDLARESGKRISLTVLGRETEIDKFLVERLMDPLLHLVRNAVSHGLEPPNEREAAGKPPEGRITLRAATVGESVVIDIEDDGRGIDVAAVAERAKEKGLLDETAVLDDATLLELISLPGFSTREEADRGSGRGVGMDVVKKSVEAMNGSMTLSTKKGHGSTFRIELPLTLAIADALIVTAGGETFAVPQAAVREIVEVEPSSIRLLENNEIVSYRDGVLPLMRLTQVFNLSTTRPDENRPFHVFVTGNGANTLGIVVDRVLGHREVVVRGIGDHLVQVPGIAGATDLGDEHVVLILDVPALRQNKLGPRGAARTAGPGAVA